MNTKFAFPDSANGLVYVKPVKVADLPEDVQAEVDGLDELFAVHDAEGQQLALVADRRMAFVLARENDYRPVTVH